MIDYKVLAQPSAIQTGDTRDNVYYPQIVNLSTLNTRGLIQAMMNMGSTAFSMGEYLGVASDLGSAIAQMLITGHKINLEGLGVFTPKVETTQKNIKEASAINSSNFSCTVVFTPSEEFIAILNSVVWNRVQSVDPGQSSSNAYTIAISNPTGNTLKFTPSKAGALNGFPAYGESITIDGVAVNASNIRYDAASGNVYVYNVMAGKHTVAISVGNTRGFDAYSNTWNNVAVAPAANQVHIYIETSDVNEDWSIKADGITDPVPAGEYADFMQTANEPISLRINNGSDAAGSVTLTVSPDSGESQGGVWPGYQYYSSGEWRDIPVAGVSLGSVAASNNVTQDVRVPAGCTFSFRVA